jgi:hypothetical protein
MPEAIVAAIMLLIICSCIFTERRMRRPLPPPSSPLSGGVQEAVQTKLLKKKADLEKDRIFAIQNATSEEELERALAYDLHVLDPVRNMEDKLDALQEAFAAQDIIANNKKEVQEQRQREAQQVIDNARYKFYRSIGEFAPSRWQSRQ